MDNLRKDGGRELVVSRFYRFCVCVRDLGEEEKMWHDRSIVHMPGRHFRFGRQVESFAFS